MSLGLDRGAARELLHIPTPGEAWAAAWHVEPLLAALLVAATLGYGLARRTAAAQSRPRPTVWQACAYVGGLAVLALALMGPPDHFAGLSFAAHMTQHLLLTLIAAPLLVVGRPVHVLLRGLGPRRSQALLRPTLGHTGGRRAAAALAHPITVSLLFNGSLVVWHHPVLYQAAVLNRPMHDLEHASFLGSALLFWWVLIEPIPKQHRPSSIATLLVLFVAWMVSDLLGAALTLAREPLYPLYASTPNPWGLLPTEDQRLGGLIMWVGGGAFFAALLIGFVAVPHLRRRPMVRSVH